MTFDKEFKEAISQLSSAEKDKLIFRLLKKDLNLANQLLFELVSSDSKEDRREKTKEKIVNSIVRIKQHCKYSTPGMLLMEMRDTNGIINEHVKITNDKYGEIYLQIFVLNEFLQIYNEYFKDCSMKQSYTLNIYCVAKVFKIMILLKKIHEDLTADFAGDLEKTGQLFGNNPCLMHSAIHNGLDVNWLIKNQIPNNVVEIEKDLRQRGYLK
ncbi:MAG: hypothetical protein LBG80_12815 [Bacteroidales bacterium]|jgi:aminopeptidase C|nr:hypothetical protein [Bacteroidales bacterium]